MPAAIPMSAWSLIWIVVIEVTMVSAQPMQIQPINSTETAAALVFSLQAAVAIIQ